MHDAALSTRTRKPKRRAPAPSSTASRLRSRAAERERAAGASTPSDALPSPEPLAQPKPHVWVAEDFVAMASELHHHGSVEFERFFGGSHPRLPPQLSRKTRGDVIALMRRMANFADAVPWYGGGRCDHRAFMAVLAAERSYVQEHKSSRDNAMGALNKARSERHRVERERVKLGVESKVLSEQMRLERAARSKLSDVRAATDSSLLSARTRFTQLKAKYTLLRDTLCKAKLSELEARRRLDRQQLKISALLGDVIIPTLDTLSKSKPLWLADIYTALEQKDELRQQQVKHIKRRSTGRPPQLFDSDANACDVAPPNIPKRAGSPFVGYDALLKESKEEQQLRLLKYRLRMCEMETSEWRQSLSYEQERIRLISRAKTRLEEDVQRQKQSNREAQTSKLTSVMSRGVSKSGAANARTIAKIRAAVRASLPVVGDGSGGATKVIVKKGRKGRALKSLTKTAHEWT